VAAPIVVAGLLTSHLTQEATMPHYRIVEEHALYFVTFSVVEWLPVFVTEAPCQIITESLNFCHREKHMRINAYVIMPTHFHAILFDEDFESQRLRRSVTALRKYTGRQLTRYCLEAQSECFSATVKAKAGKDRKYRFWQDGIHPEAIYSEAFWRQKFNYLHENPCRKGLVWEPAHWRFSSAGWWVEGMESDVPLTAVEW
jgi:REP element-mobilizing transposase RayT